MKKFINKLRDKYKSLPIKSRNLFKIGVILALVVALPLFVFAIQNINLEIRKRAASGEPGQPTSITTWETAYAKFQASDFYIMANGQKFVGTPIISVRSDPGSSTYQTLEMVWFENNKEMRMNLYFKADSTHWWLDEARVYNGTSSPDWITFFANTQTFKTQLGSEFVQNTEGGFVFNNSAGQMVGEVHWDNLNLKAFNQLGVTCQRVPFGISVIPSSQTGSPGQRLSYNIVVRNYDRGICQPAYGSDTFAIEGLYPGWSVDRQTFSYSSGLGETYHFKIDITSATNAEIGNYSPYIRVNGYTSNHNTTISIPYNVFAPGGVCWNFVIGSVNPLNWPNGCRGNPNPPGACTQALVPLSAEEVTGFNAWVAAGRPSIPGCSLNQTSTPSPSPNAYTCSTNADCTCGRDPATNQCMIGNRNYVTGFCNTPDFCTGISGRCGPACVNNRCQFLCPGATSTPVGTPSPTSTPTPTATPATTQIMRFLVKFAGVTDNKAEGAKITVRFSKGSYDRITSPFSVSHVGNGVYEGQIDLSTDPVPVGGDYTFFVKGEKHLATRFCQQAGTQTTRCTGPGRINVFSGTFLYGFQHLALEPGDLPSQDGAANGNDFQKIKNLLTKSCAELTTADKLTADLDYSGCINVRDAFLMRQTLENRYDD